jgi:ferrous iron transport protein B
MWEAGWSFLVRAGTIILAAMVLVWALLYFPHTDANGRVVPGAVEKAEDEAKASPTG